MSGLSRAFSRAHGSPGRPKKTRHSLAKPKAERGEVRSWRLGAGSWTLRRLQEAGDWRLREAGGGQKLEAGGTWRLEEPRPGGWRLEGLEGGGWALEAGGWRLEARSWRGLEV